MTSLRWRRGYTEHLGAVAVAVTGGLVVGSSTWLRSALPLAVVQTALIAVAIGVAVLSTARAVRSARLDGSASSLGSIVFGFGMLFAVVIPGLQLLAGQRVTITAELGFSSTDPTADVLDAYLLFVASLAAFTFGERLATSRPRGRVRLPGWLSRGDDERLRGIFWALVFIGVFISIAAPGAGTREALTARGEVTGQGVVSLLRFSVPVAVALGMLRGHWGSRWAASASFLLTMYFLLGGGTRTPLLIVGIAIFCRLIAYAARTRASWRTAALALLAAYAGIVLIGGIASWRERVVASSSGASLTASLAFTASHPLTFTQGGVDTIDGLTLATNVERQDVAAHWWDPAKVVLGFVPHQIWPDKPEWLSGIVTREYTNFGGLSGIFLSGPGYLLIVFGSVPAMLAAFLALGFAAETLFHRLQIDSMGSVLLTYFLLRFFFAGDAFDAFHTLNLVVVLGIAWVLSTAARFAFVLSRRTPRYASQPSA